MTDRKIFHNGDIVYWCHQKGYNYSVHFGIVDLQYDGGTVDVDYLVPRERRRVNGIPIDEFENEDKYKKLPKGWSYDTELFKVTYDDYTAEEIDFGMTNNETQTFITNPKKIKEAYDKGYLVKKKTIFRGIIEADITTNGYRIIKTYPRWGERVICHVSINPYQLFSTYEEAKKIVDDNKAEFIRQSELSDYDWSVEQIDKTLEHYKILTHCSDREIQRYRKFILDLDNVEDIDTRVSLGNIQWKYCKNQRWNNIELGVDIEALNSKSK